MNFDDLRKTAPPRFSDEAILVLKRGYLLEDEDIPGMIHRLAMTAVEYYPEGYKGYSQVYIYNSLVNAFSKGWISPASPVASNLGANRGLPVSCFGIEVPNSIYDIMQCGSEISMLTKNGGGIGLDLSLLVGDSKVTTWALEFDRKLSSVAQSKVRRGSGGLYLDIDHPDIDLFLHAKDLAKGDMKTKLQSNIAVKISDKFMESLPTNEVNRKRLFSIIELRMKYGSPYIYFTDTVLRDDPLWYKDKSLSTKHSQLCTEIFLHSDKEHTYSCVLSSMNLRYYDEWKDLALSLPELGTLFLDAVNSEFISKARQYQKNKGNDQSLEKSIQGAIKGRPLGLGVYGLHAYYMSKNVPFESDEARNINRSIFDFIERRSTEATQELAEMLGEPEWCKGHDRRNSHNLAIAPTTTSSIIGGGISPGIEPLMANYFSMSGAKGTFVRKNPFLESLLKDKNQDNEFVWNSIRQHSGSVQHLDFLTDYEKDVFKTAFEINQEEIVSQAAERQIFIDQGQSLNLFIRPDESAQSILDLHINAWKKGLKTLYYVRSESFMNKESSTDLGVVHIKSRENCTYCKKAKKLLRESGIEYTEVEKPEGRVPEIWVKGDMLEDGYTSLVKILDTTGSYSEKKDCAECDA